ncbi:FG-GAP-like repeat-containing protein [Pseudomarimonas arenosa]|uniref:VCBS repeat-containing protein n=1 Tax=Pseudomarimonas arenosa TaxID=2774145 RepID=A0AAW3ZMN6_9GAMM|nr:FG-GAP-like repeat-containing protein [Pseudomarimonas arenosa]MBD8526434.1 VCBS repeat-containing protein [Pseudomarimonas arenosa]
MQHLISVLLLAMATPALASSLSLSELPSEAGFKISSSTSLDSLGSGGIGSAGDLNGDGLNDFFVVRNGGEGGVLVVLGSAAGFVGDYGVDVNAWSGGFEVRGSIAGGYIETASAVGDINGDGYDDLALGAPNSFPISSGYACILFGRSSFPAQMSTDALSHSACFSGGQEYDNVGYSISAAGDFNGDGFDDFAITAPLANFGDTDSGSVYLVFGQSLFPSQVEFGATTGVTFSRFDGLAQGDYFGMSVAHGDFNGDGKSDLAIGAEDVQGAQGPGGSVYVVYGQSEPLDAVIPADTISGNLGFEVTSVSLYGNLGRTLATGNFNGDGYDDLLVGDGNGGGDSSVVLGSAVIIFGSPRRNQELSVGVLNGLNGTVIQGVLLSDRLGERVGSAGDFNGDGIEDLLLGALGDSRVAASAGSVRILYGRPVGQWSALMNVDQFGDAEVVDVQGASASGQCGVRVSGAGDFDRDYKHDVIVSCNGEGALDEYMGAVYVLHGQFVPVVFKSGFD